MKNKLKSIIALVFAVMVSINTFAYDFEKNGIYYNINSDGTTVSVTYNFNNGNYNSYSGDVTIPSSVTYNGTTYSVTAIGEYAFEDCTGLTSVTIPNSVTEIGYDAFLRCKKLTSVTIPNSVTVINAFAFADCQKLTSITIPKDVIYIGYEAFEDSGLKILNYNADSCKYDREGLGKCENLQVVNIGNNVRIIPENFIKGCNKVKVIKLPNSVTKIGNYAFADCTGLESINIPDGVTSINSSIFSGCTGLKTLVIGNGITSIYNDFPDCYNLENVIIPNSVTYIADSAFAYKDLKRIVVPKYVNHIGKQAFQGVDTVVIFASTPPDLEYDYKKYDNTLVYHSPSDGKMFVGCDQLSLYQNDQKWKSIEKGGLYGAVMDVQSKELSQGQTYNFYGNTINSSGWYLHVKGSDFGCDTIVCLKVIKDEDDIIVNLDEEDSVSEVIDGHWASQITSTSARLNFYSNMWSDIDGIEEDDMCKIDKYFIIKGGGLNKTISANGTFTSGLYADLTGLKSNTTYEFGFYFIVDWYDGQIDTNRTYNTSEMPYFKTHKTSNAGLAEVEQLDLIKIYPNPTRNQVTVEGEGEIMVINSLGQIVYKTNKANKTDKSYKTIATIDVSGWQSGVYYVKVGETTKKLIVE